VFDVGVAVLFGLLGYVFIKLKCEPAPLLLGFVLGPMLEENLRKAMTISRGDPSVFFTRPLSLSMLLVAAVLLLIMIVPTVRRRRAQAFQEA
jgi:TctA family transporter